VDRFQARERTVLTLVIRFTGGLSAYDVRRQCVITDRDSFDVIAIRRCISDCRSESAERILASQHLYTRCIIFHAGEGQCCVAGMNFLSAATSTR